MFEFPQMPAAERIRLVTSATPPSFGDFVATAFCKSVTVADTTASVLHRLNAISDNEVFNGMLDTALQNFDEASAMLRPSALDAYESRTAATVAAASSADEADLRHFVNIRRTI